MISPKVHFTQKYAGYVYIIQSPITEFYTAMLCVQERKEFEKFGILDFEKMDHVSAICQKKGDRSRMNGFPICLFFKKSIKYFQSEGISGIPFSLETAKNVLSSCVPIFFKRDLSFPICIASFKLNQSNQPNDKSGLFYYFYHNYIFIYSLPNYSNNQQWLKTKTTDKNICCIHHMHRIDDYHCPLHSLVYPCCISNSSSKYLFSSI